MQRLPGFQQNVVGDIDYIVYRSDTRSQQARFHPQRRRRNSDILDYPAYIACAEIRVIDFNLNLIGGFFVNLHHFDFRTRDCLAGQCRDFACDTYYANGVGAVGSQFELQRIIFHHQRLGQRLSNLRIPGQFNYT